MLSRHYAKLAALCIPLVSVAFGAAEARTRLIASLQGPMETAYGQAYVRFDQCVKDKTKGELWLETYPNAQLGGLTEALEQTRQGAVDITAVAPGILSEFVPEVQVFTIPFVFKSLDNWKAVVSGPVGEKLADLVLKKGNVRVIGYFGGSTRQVVSKKPINTLADMKGFVMRLLPGEVVQTAWSSVGAVPSSVALAEVYNALQLGVIQGLDNEPEWILRMKFYEQAPNIALTSHEIVTRLMIFSEKRYQALPKDMQAVVTECGKVASAFERDVEIKLDKETLDLMVSKHNVKTTTIDQETFKRTVAAAVSPLVQKYGLTDLVKEIEAAR